MENTIIYYYSKNGSNKFLAQKLSQKLQCENEEIKPRINARILLLMRMGMGLKKLKNKPQDFKRIILVGPVWMGQLITPLKQFLSKNKNQIDKLIFVTCCGSSFEMKHEKFGHGNVFNLVKSMMGDKCISCKAFPITLVVPKEQKEDPKVVMGTQLTRENFKGEISELFDSFVEELQSPDLKA